MPAGISNPVLGYAAFTAIKLCGYSLAGRFISRSYTKDRSAWLVGTIRTGIGIVAGALYYGAMLLISDIVPRSGGLWFYAGFLPVRIAEWWLLLWIFYDRKLDQKAKGWKLVALATVWSYVLDIPAMAGFFLTGGFWIC